MLFLTIGIFEGVQTQFAFFGFKAWKINFVVCFAAPTKICSDSLTCEIYCTLHISSLEFCKRKSNDPISNSFYTEEYQGLH